MSFLYDLYFFQGQKYTSFGKNILLRQSTSLGRSSTGDPASTKRSFTGLRGVRRVGEVPGPDAGSQGGRQPQEEERQGAEVPVPAVPDRGAVPGHPQQPHEGQGSHQAGEAAGGAAQEARRR